MSDIDFNRQDLKSAQTDFLIRIIAYQKATAATLVKIHAKNEQEEKVLKDFFADAYVREYEDSIKNFGLITYLQKTKNNKFSGMIPFIHVDIDSDTPMSFNGKAILDWLASPSYNQLAKSS